MHKKLYAVVLALVFSLSFVNVASATLAPPMPMITSLEPEMAKEGDVIIIRGQNFGNNPDLYDEKFVAFRVQNLVPSDVAEILSWSDTEVQVVVPKLTQPFSYPWSIFVGYKVGPRWYFSNWWQPFIPIEPEDPDKPEVPEQPEVPVEPEEPESPQKPMEPVIYFTGDYEVEVENGLCYVQFDLHNTMTSGQLIIHLYADGEFDHTTGSPVVGLLGMKLLFTKGCPEREFRIVLEMDGEFLDMYTIELQGPILVHPLEFTGWWEMTDEEGYCYLRWGIEALHEVSTFVEIFFDGELVGSREWDLSKSHVELQFQAWGQSCPKKSVRIDMHHEYDVVIFLHHFPSVGDGPREEEPPVRLFIPQLTN